jgi:hypothetical protein
MMEPSSTGLCSVDSQSPASIALQCEAAPPQRRFQGSMNVTTDAWWFGELAIPDDSGLALIELTRHGAASTVPTADDEVAMMIALEDLPTVHALLGHLIADARLTAEARR